MFPNPSDNENVLGIITQQGAKFSFNHDDDDDDDHDDDDDGDDDDDDDGHRQGEDLIKIGCRRH